jgi:hypothetical protein
MHYLFSQYVRILVMEATGFSILVRVLHANRYNFSLLPNLSKNKIISRKQNISSSTLNCSTKMSYSVFQWAGLEVEHLDYLRKLATDEEAYSAKLAATALRAKEDRHFVVVPCFRILIRDLFALNRSCCER